MRQVRQTKGELRVFLGCMNLNVTYSHNYMKLLIRVERAADRDRWVSCLNDASKLTVHDLYDFDESKCIGQGRYASVYKACRIDENGESLECAIKVVEKSEFWSRVVKSMERADTLVREASVQATLASKGVPLPTILKLGSLFETPDNLVFEVELLEGTDLFRYVSLKGSLSESEAACIIRDVLVGLEMMCRFGIAHRDVKPANILMCNKESDGVHVKLADFGMSTFAGVDGLLRGRCGTPGYVAPEIFSAGVNGGYGNKVDIFSTGVTLYIMLCGYEPFYGETDAELINANREALVEFPDSDWSNGELCGNCDVALLRPLILIHCMLVSAEARDLVRAMLEADPRKRISAKDALQHPWICNRTAAVAKPVELRGKDFVAGAACVIS
jgi:serine/threonine protein kinase